MGGLHSVLRVALFWRNLSVPRAVRLRHALEALGPIFVKFGQILSTRRDLLPEDIADELARLQDQVPPFPGDEAVALIELAQGKPVSEIFKSFDRTALASASVAQVHLAELHDGREAAVKVLRPRIAQVIRDDLELLDAGASLLEWLWSDGKRLKPHEVVAEFGRHLDDELDLMREAANASQLRRNFAGSPLLAVPEIYWEYCSTDVMVMERMHGTPVSQVDTLRAQGVDIPKLARAGVEIFFSQVFRDGFFHADMHPGNILVTPTGQYVALDFGIMGSLTPTDKNYLAQNFLAFFRRDYRRVALAHIESGWIPADTRVDAFETAIRAVCEPIFDKPLRDISFGKLLLRLFQTSRRFNMAVQPQLVMLQKTLLNIEGLGSRSRSRSRFMGHRETVPRTLDVRTSGLARAAAAGAGRSPVLGHHAATTAAPDSPRTERGPREPLAAAGRDFAKRTAPDATFAGATGHAVCHQYGAGRAAGVVRINREGASL